MPASLRAFWRFNESAVGTIKDDMGNYPLTVTGSPVVASGKRDNALEFTRTSGADAVAYALGTANAQAVADALSSWVIDFWIWHKSGGDTTGSETILSLEGSVAEASGSETEAQNRTLAVLWVPSTRRLSINWERNAGSQGAAEVALVAAASLAGLTDEAWHHVAIAKVVSGATATVQAYLNGTLVETLTGKSVPTGGAGSPQWMISHSWSSAGTRTGQLHARVDDLRFWAGEMTDAEVASLPGAPFAVTVASGGRMVTTQTNAARLKAEVSRG
jgi:hypothetical protein